MAQKLCQLKKKGGSGGAIDFASMTFVKCVTVANYSALTISFQASNVGDILLISGGLFSTASLSDFTFTGMDILFSDIHFQTTTNRSDIQRGMFTIIAKVTNTNTSVKLNVSNGYITWGISEYH